MQKYSAKSVTEYISSSTPESQSLLKELQQLILTTVDGVEEKISWGVPFYRHSGDLCGFAVYKHHVSFGLASTLDQKVRLQLEKLGYKTGSKTIQIKFGQPVPIEILKQLLLDQVKKNTLK